MSQTSPLPKNCKSVRLTRNLGKHFKKGTMFVMGSLKVSQDGHRESVYFAVPTQFDPNGIRSWLSEGFIHGDFTKGFKPKVWTTDLFEAVIEN